jgi:hypothetical protein
MWPKAATTRFGLPKASSAIQAALMNTHGVPPEDFYRRIFEFPKTGFLHTPSFVGMHYADDLIALLSGQRLDQKKIPHLTVIT